MIRSRSKIYVKERDYSAPSETVPDQTLTIRQLMQRFVRGLPPSGVDRSDSLAYDEECKVDSKGYLHGNGDWNIDPCNQQNLDLTDIDEMGHELNDITNAELDKYRQRRKRDDESDK